MTGTEIPTREQLALIQLTWLMCSNRDITALVSSGGTVWTDVGRELHRSGLSDGIPPTSRPRLTRHFSTVPPSLGPDGDRVLSRHVLAMEIAAVAEGEPAGPLLNLVATAAGIMHDYVDTFWTNPPCPPREFYEAGFNEYIKATVSNPPTAEQLALLFVTWLVCSNRNVTAEVASGDWESGELMATGIADRISPAMRAQMSAHFATIPMPKSTGGRVLSPADLEAETNSGGTAGPLLKLVATAAGIMHDYVDTFIWTNPPCPPIEYYTASLAGMVAALP